MAEMRRWERDMSRICSDPAPLSVVNDVDFSLPPEEFTYINAYIVSDVCKKIFRNFIDQILQVITLFIYLFFSPQKE